MHLITTLKRLLPNRWKHQLKIWLRELYFRWDQFRGRQTVLIHLALAGQLQYILPIVEALRKRNAKVTFYLTCTFRATEPDVAPLRIPSWRRRVWEDCKTLKGIDALITSTQWVFDVPATRWRICVFHGQPSKGNTFVTKYVRNFNVFFLLGPLQRSLYEEFSAQHPNLVDGIQALNVGYPKSDAILNGMFSRQEVLQRLGLNPKNPTVIYAPAFDPGTSLDIYGDEVIRVLVEMDIQINILVKLHPMTYDPDLSKRYTRGWNWTDKLREFESRPNFRHLGNVPLDQYLAASDVLVTDISGAALEFFMLDKPVLFIDCPDFFKRTLVDQTQHIDAAGYIHSEDEILPDIRMNAGRSAGIVVPDPSHLPDAVKRSLKFPEEFSPQRQAVRSQLLYNPGKAAEVAADTLLKLISTDQTTDRRP
jgi:hypothetical protein